MTISQNSASMKIGDLTAPPNARKLKLASLFKYCQVIRATVTPTR